MFDRLLFWPRIIGVLVGGIGLIGLVGMAPALDIYMHSIDRRDLVSLSCFAVFVVLSCPLFRGRDWAHLVLVGAAILLGMYFLLRPVTRLVMPHKMSGPGPLGKWIALQHALGDVGEFLLVLTLLVFVILLLCHRDVVATFRRP